jgi:hypothetical protein
MKFVIEEKFILGLFCIFALGGVACASAHWVAIQPVFGSLVGGVCGIYTVYCGGHAVNRWVDSQGNAGDGDDKK